MNADLWQQIDDAFTTAVTLEASDARKFIYQRCGDDDVFLREVESMVAADSSPSDLLDRPAIESAAVLFDLCEPRLEPLEQVGHYEVVSLLGTGGMGEVYLARDLILERSVALKLLPAEDIAYDDRLIRFRREAQALSELNHPNILTIYEFGEDAGRQFICTELVSGETLRDRMRGGPIQPDEAVRIAQQVASALSAAHAAGIIHRDIKPENIMLRPDGLVKVLDFGLARPAEMDMLAASSSLRVDTGVSSGLLLGTARYLSPEQMAGGRADARSDIYSLGVVIYEMVTGSPPFPHKDVARLREAVLHEVPPGLETPDAATARLMPVVGRMLSKDPLDRYAAVEDAALQLADAISHGEPRSSGDKNRLRRHAIPAIAVVLGLGTAAAFLGSRFLNGPATASAAGEKRVETAAPSWSSLPPLPSPRWNTEPAVVGDTLYLIGGWNGCEPFGDVKALDPATNTWIDRAWIPTPRGTMGAAVLDGKIYTIGGSIDCGVQSDAVEVYDPAANAWSIKAPLPHKRVSHALAAADGKVFAIGGEDGTRRGYLSSVLAYDPLSNTWSERAPMPSPRSGAAAVTVGGLIFVMGGSGAEGTLSSVDVYDPMKDRWTSRAPMPGPRTQFAAAELGGLIYIFGSSRAPMEISVFDPKADSWSTIGEMKERRSAIRAAAFNGSIVIPGGLDGTVPVSEVIVFRPATLAEPSCPRFTASEKAAMPTTRNNMTVGEIDGVIYAAGGYSAESGFLASNEAYLPTEDRWEKRAPLPAGRETRGTNNAVVDGKLFVIGGNASGQCSGKNEAYDPATDHWQTRAPMPTPRCHLAVVATGGLIYAIGGTNTSGTVKYSSVEIYDPASDTWRSGPPMPTARQDPGAAVIDGTIYIIGGGNPAVSIDGDLDTVEALDTRSGVWTTRRSMSRPRTAPAVTTFDGTIVAAGGSPGSGDGSIEVYYPEKDEWSGVQKLAAAGAFRSGLAVRDQLYLFGSENGTEAANRKTTSALQILPCSAGY